MTPRRRGRNRPNHKSRFLRPKPSEPIVSWEEIALHAHEIAFRETAPENRPGTNPRREKELAKYVQTPGARDYMENINSNGSQHFVIEVAKIFRNPPECMEYLVRLRAIHQQFKRAK